MQTNPLYQYLSTDFYYCHINYYRVFISIRHRLSSITFHFPKSGNTHHTSQQHDAVWFSVQNLILFQGVGTYQSCFLLLIGKMNNRDVTLQRLYIHFFFSSTSRKVWNSSYSSCILNHFGKRSVEGRGSSEPTRTGPTIVTLLRKFSTRRPQTAWGLSIRCNTAWLKKLRWYQKTHFLDNVSILVFPITVSNSSASLVTSNQELGDSCLKVYMLITTEIINLCKIIQPKQCQIITNNSFCKIKLQSVNWSIFAVAFLTN